MNNKPKIILLITSGFSIRNYLVSNFFKELNTYFELIIIFPEELQRVKNIIDENINVHLISIDNYSPSKFVSLIHLIIETATNIRLGYRNKNIEPRRDHYLKISTRIIIKITRIISYLFLSDYLYYFFIKIERYLSSNSLYGQYISKILVKQSSKMIISTDPYNSTESLVSLIGTNMDIDTLAIPLSWDNLTYKGHLLPNYNYYAVWSDMMKRDLISHGVNHNNIMITGSLQFDAHKDEKYLWDKEKFLSRVGLDNCNYLITYTTSTQRSFPLENKLIEDIIEGLLKEDFKFNFLIRTHPNDEEPDRFKLIEDKYGNLVVTKPWEYDTNNWWNFNPSSDDIALLTNTLRYSDTIINVASTITLDSIVFDTPVVNIAYYPEKSQVFAPLIENSHLSIHYSEVTKRKGVIISRSNAETISAISHYIKSPEYLRQERKDTLSYVAGKVDGKSYSRLIKFLRKIYDTHNQ